MLVFPPPRTAPFCFPRPPPKSRCTSWLSRVSPNMSAASSGYRSSGSSVPGWKASWFVLWRALCGLPISLVKKRHHAREHIRGAPSCLSGLSRSEWHGRRRSSRGHLERDWVDHAHPDPYTKRPWCAFRRSLILVVTIALRFLAFSTLGRPVSLSPSSVLYLEPHCVGKHCWQALLVNAVRK